MAANLGLEQPGAVFVVAIANAGKSVEEVELAVNAEIEKLCNELVSEDEFQMVKAAKEYEVALGLTSLSSIAEDLAMNHTYFKEANRVNTKLANYSAITREELKNVAAKYFNNNNRVVIHYLPE
jgi:predicted Zn-dependent peptidase